MIKIFTIICGVIIFNIASAQYYEFVPLDEQSEEYNGNPSNDVEYSIPYSIEVGKTCQSYPPNGGVD